MDARNRTDWGRSPNSPYLVMFVEACSPDSMIIPEAATIVLCTPDDGRDGRPKHVNNLAVNKYLHTDASRWISST